MQITLNLVEEDYLEVCPDSSDAQSGVKARGKWRTPQIPHKTDQFQAPAVDQNASQDELFNFVSSHIDSISDAMRPLSLKIHDNPEVNYKEYIAHKTLTDFMKTRKGWKVTTSAYDIPTAFIAQYDSGKKGPVISYNAEYGENSTPHCSSVSDKIG